MPRKIIKDVFLRDKKEEMPLVEELEMEKTKKSRFLFKFIAVFLILILLGAFGFVVLNRISTVAINISPIRRHWRLIQGLGRIPIRSPPVCRLRLCD